MAPRIILYTGKGGVGKTSIAAATARRCAKAGLATIVLSTDPAHSLSDSLETEVAGVPTRCAQNLYAHEVVAQSEMERHWDAVQDWIGELLAERGVDRITAHELTVPPGMDELFSLLQIKNHLETGDFDTIVVDCAPTGETLRLLSFPDVAGWWLDKLFGFEQWMSAATRPLAKSVFDVSLPTEAVFEDIRRLIRNLAEMNTILRDQSRTSVRLVTSPDRMVVNEAMRTFTYLNLYGYLTDAVVVNKVFPPQAEEGYFAAWRSVQKQQLELVESAFSPLPILIAPYLEREVVGALMLDRLADTIFSEHDPGALLYDNFTQELTSDNETATLRIALPFVDKADIDVKKVGLEMVIGVGDHKRTIALPQTMASYRPKTARFENGALKVFFEQEDDRVQASHRR